MMNYKLVNYTADISTPNIQFADVLETTTNQTLKQNMSVPKARDLVRYLNMGGGFDGFTPAFFLAQVPPIAIGDTE